MWIVVKFGGTSIGSGDKIQKAMRLIKHQVKNLQLMPIVVLSAASSLNKKEGTTSRLMKACQAAVTSDDFEPIIEQVGEYHQLLIDQLQLSHQSHELALSLVAKEVKRLRTFLRASLTIGEMSLRIRDLIIASGERLICFIFAAALSDVLSVDSEQRSGNGSHDGNETLKCNGAVYVGLDDVLSKEESEKTSMCQIDQSFYDILREKIVSRVLSLAITKEHGYRVPVVTGFIGLIPNGILETVGRGYTDFTAAFCAAGLKSLHLSGVKNIIDYRVQELQIRKEVPGIYSADPSKVESAQLLSTLRPEEVAELTYYGGEVIHPFTMEQVMRMSVPIRILGCDIADIGTLIVPGKGSDQNTNANSDDDDYQSRLATATTLKQNILVLNIRSNKKTHSHGFLARVFETLNDYGIVVDLISTSEVNVSMAISYVSNGFGTPAGSPAPSRKASAATTPSAAAKENQAPQAMPAKLTALLTDLKRHGTPSLVQNQSILSLIGLRMKNAHGIASRMFTTLARLHVNVEIISQGASEVNISCVVAGDHGVRGLRGIHNTCVLGRNIDDVVAEIDNID